MLHRRDGALRSSRVAVLVLLLVVLQEFVPARAQSACFATAPCFPWNVGGPACIRGLRMSLRFLVGLARENYFGTPDNPGTEAIYAFCPVVDTLQVFNLNGAPFITSAYKVGTEDEYTYAMTATKTPRYISAFGFGDAANRLLPNVTTSTGSVMVAGNGETYCGNPNYVAIATFLMLEVGAHKGLFNYMNVTRTETAYVANPNYNASECAGSMGQDGSDSASGSVDHCSPFILQDVIVTSQLPAKTGFVPTCSLNANGEDVCILNNDDTMTCIGDTPGQRNCATCYSADNLELLANATIQVLTSYFGTDLRGRTFTSGGGNPLNYRQFAGYDVFGDISNSLSGLWNKTLSFVNFPII